MLRPDLYVTAQDTIILTQQNCSVNCGNNVMYDIYKNTGWIQVRTYIVTVTLTSYIDVIKRTRDTKKPDIEATYDRQDWKSYRQPGL